MTIIGRGIFQWDGSERRTDRYGTFVLTPYDEDSSVTTGGGKAEDHGAFLDVAALAGFLDKPARIIAKVVEARPSKHIGDLFRQIMPSTPEVGEIIDLGVGILFTEESTWQKTECCGDIFIGLRPNDGRDTDWFDPRKLYRLHSQTVEITIEAVADLPTVDKVPPTEVDGVIMAPFKDGDRTSVQKKQTRES